MQQILLSSASYIKKVLYLHSKKGRKKFRQFIGQGKRTCQSLIDSKLVLEKILVTDQHVGWAKSVAHDNKIIHVLDPYVMKKASTTKTPSGIIGIFNIPKQPIPKNFNEGLVLANIGDPGNAGTLIRSAAAFGTNSIILVESVDPWNPKVVQSTAGTIGSVKIYELSWQEVLHYKGESLLYALVVDNGASLSSAKNTPHLLVVGSEAHGIPKEWVKDCDVPITIPMSGKTESLNAAVAGSIALYNLQKK